MNERIKQLWEQAAKTTQGDSWEEQTKFMEKYTELIVRECAEFQTNRSTERHGYDKHEDGVAIKEHFGVGE